MSSFESMHLGLVEALAGPLGPAQPLAQRREGAVGKTGERPAPRLQAASVNVKQQDARIPGSLRRLSDADRRGLARLLDGTETRAYQPSEKRERRETIPRREPDGCVSELASAAPVARELMQHRAEAQPACLAERVSDPLRQRPTFRGNFERAIRIAETPQRDGPPHAADHAGILHVQEDVCPMAIRIVETATCLKLLASRDEVPGVHRCGTERVMRVDQHVGIAGSFRQLHHVLCKDHEARLLSALRQRRQQVERRKVAPVQILHDEEERRLLRQRADGLAIGFSSAAIPSRRSTPAIQIPIHSRLNLPVA